MSENQNLEWKPAFKPAQLSTGTDWFVYFYAMDPVTGKLKRKRIKCNHIHSTAERKKYAKHIIEEINQKLYAGWNPFLETEARNGLTKIEVVLDKFLRAKKKELRDNSMRSYNSYVFTFKEYLKSEQMIDTFSININNAHAVNFMNYIYDEKDVSANTFNNYRNFFKLLWNWMIANNYASSNIFDKIQRKKAQEKERTIIPENIRTKIKNYFKENDYDMYIACTLVYHTLLRPKEVTYLKPSDFSLKHQTINISAEAAKNHKARKTTIPDNLVQDIFQWNFGGAGEQQFIFGTDWKPNTQPINPRRLAKKWDKMRKALKLPMNYQLYSLRDSGIVALLKDGVSPDEVMKQAGHSSLEITTIYARHFNNTGSEEIKEKASEF